MLNRKSFLINNLLYSFYSDIKNLTVLEDCLDTLKQGDFLITH